MYPIDAIKINFSQDNLLALNLIMAFFMFVIALDIKRSDFDILWKNPKPPIVGMIGQLIIVPALTIGLVYLLQPPPSVALGMVAISACPGGNSSNFSAYLAKANTALAVTTTSLSILFCIVTMPLYIWLGAMILPNKATLQRDVFIEPFEMVRIIGLLIILPLLGGMYCHHRFPKTTAILLKPAKTLALILFFGLIIFAMLANFENIKNYVGKVFWAVFFLNILALGTGYWFGKLNALSEADCRALTFETGIHNITLALIIIFNFFDGLGGMALVAAWYGIWDLITGFGLAIWWGRK